MSRLLLNCTLASAVLLFAAVPPAEAAKPGSVEVVVPDGAITSPSATLTWRKTKGATFYQIQVFNKKDKQVLSTTVTNSDAGCASQAYCSLVPDEPFASGPYRWRVRAANSDGSGPWSDYADFWVGGPGVFESPLVGMGIHEVVSGPQTVTQIEVKVPGPGAIRVTTTGLLTCYRTNSTGTVDISTVVTEDPEDIAQGVQPGILVFWSTMTANQQLTHPQSTGRVFPVEQAGKKTFYWRSNGFVDDTDDDCKFYAATLTAEYFPWGGVLDAPESGAGAVAAGPSGSALAR
jgi:hypothetical protein